MHWRDDRDNRNVHSDLSWNVGRWVLPGLERGVFQGTAVGQTTGTVYRVIISAMDPGVTNVTPSGAVESADVLVYRFVAPSGEDDLLLRIAHHTTFNANGALTANPVVVDAQCFQ
jgi:hypothetical protein